MDYYLISFSIAKDSYSAAIAQKTMLVRADSFDAACARLREKYNDMYLRDFHNQTIFS